jgi:hypothetical protein
MKPVHYIGPFAAIASNGAITITWATGTVCGAPLPGIRDRSQVTCKRCTKQFEREIPEKVRPRIEALFGVKL